MSKLDEILGESALEIQQYGATPEEFGSSPEIPKEAIKDLMLELIGDMEERETSDMTLKSWTNEDYKAFGKNELKAELRQKVAEL